VTADGAVSLEWRVFVGIRVCCWVCTFWTAFVELCVGAQLLVGTGAGRLLCMSRCAQSGGGGVGVGGLAPRAEPHCPCCWTQCGAQESRGTARTRRGKRPGGTNCPGGQVRVAHVGRL
jgi:hypothetical protein